MEQPIFFKSWADLGRVIEALHAVVLETDGTFSVVWQMVEKSDSTLCDVNQERR